MSLILSGTDGLSDVDGTAATPAFEEGTIAVLNNSVGVGYTYNNGVFTEPQPYASWILVDNTWTAPIEKPNDGKFYMWDEETISWKGTAL